MRSETLYLWGSVPDPLCSESTAFNLRIEGSRPLPTQRDDHYAVEVCWVVNGLVRCRTVQVHAATETLAVSIARQRTSKKLNKQVNAIEAVDIERFARPNRREH